MPTIESIYRYPVKGLSAEPLTEVLLRRHECLPYDREYALARPGAPFDPARPVWLRKTHFLCLMTDAPLAELRVRYEAASGQLAIEHGGVQVIAADLRSSEGRQALERFFGTFMAGTLTACPRLVSAAGHSFTDHAAKRVSLINLATVEEIERRLGHPVDPLRFRGNLYVSGLPAWAELGWVGRELSAGEVRLKVTDRIDRCAATNVDPATGIRDLNIPAALRRHYGHIDCGVLLRVVRGGRIATGQTIAPIPKAAQALS